MRSLEGHVYHQSESSKKIRALYLEPFDIAKHYLPLDFLSKQVKRFYLPESLHQLKKDLSRGNYQDEIKQLEREQLDSLFFGEIKISINEFLKEQHDECDNSTCEKVTNFHCLSRILNETARRNIYGSH